MSEHLLERGKAIRRGKGNREGVTKIEQQEVVTTPLSVACLIPKKKIELKNLKKERTFVKKGTAKM
jgi:hypothetical protein